MENVRESASRIKDMLRSQGSLNLWEVRTILNETRDGTLQVLLWMASRKEIVYCLKDQELHVSLAVSASERRESWEKQSSRPLEGSVTRSVSRAS
jgi:hypothetical protein